MEYILEGVPYIAQPTNATCWLASYQMMLAYKGRDTSDAESLPNDAEMRERGIMDAEFPICRNKLGMSSSIYEGFLTLESLKIKLEMYGPIWVSGDYCEGTYKHIVVLIGIRDPFIGAAEVCINDPYSGYKYGLSKSRWIPLKRFANKLNRVAYACQHWG